MTSWILPRQLISAYALATEGSTLDSVERSLICERLLMRRSKRSPARTYLREWKAGNLTRLQSGLISNLSRGERFLDEWTSSLAVTHANHSLPQENASAQTTPATSGHSSQMEFRFFDPASASLKMSRDTFPSDCERSLANWNQWVTRCRGEYSRRVKLAHLTRESESSSWPTANARDRKDSVNSVPPSVGQTRGYSLGMAVAEKIWPTASTRDYKGAPSTEAGWIRPDNGRLRNDTLDRAVALQKVVNRRTPTTEAMFNLGHPAPINPSTDGNLLESWLTPIAEKLNPRWVETLMGLPVGWTMPSCFHPIANPASAVMMSSAGNAGATTQIVHALGQIAVVNDNRTDELRLLGNGVVPATATLAFQTLLTELLNL